MTKRMDYYCLFIMNNLIYNSIITYAKFKESAEIPTQCFRVNIIEIFS